MAREWAIYSYKARLDSAIEAERWDEADRTRVAAKRRLLEMINMGSDEGEIAAARDALADSFDRLRLSQRVRIKKGPLAMATRISTDAETAGIAAEQERLPEDTARDVKERIIQLLSSGNRRPWTTSELAKKTERSVETVSRAVSQLRAERKIISRRMGRHVLHRLAILQRDAFAKNDLTTMSTRRNSNWVASIESAGTPKEPEKKALVRFLGRLIPSDTNENRGTNRQAPLAPYEGNCLSAELLSDIPSLRPSQTKSRLAITNSKLPSLSVIHIGASAVCHERKNEPFRSH